MTENLYLARQPIVNINRKIIGYELLFRDSKNGISVMPSNVTATAKLLYNALNHMDISTIISGDQRAFINCDHTVISAGFLDILDPMKFSIELLETTVVSDDLVKRVHQLHAKGFKIAIDDFNCTREMYSRFAPIMKYVSTVKICLQAVDLQKCSMCVNEIKSKGITMLAEKIEDKITMDKCIKLGFTLFQGYYISKPEVLESSSYSEITKIMILKLIADIKKDADTDQLILTLKGYPDLSLQLMKFASNRTKNATIASLRHLVQLIGRNDLTRWCLMYLQSEMSGSGLSENLINLAIARAEELERLSESVNKDKAYIVGLISALANVFETDISELMSGLSLEDSIRNAIIYESGDMGVLLKEVMKAEKEKLCTLIMLNKHSIPVDQMIKMVESLNLQVVQN